MLAGIAYKVASTLVFACMMAVVKALNQYPVGELVFFRSFFAPWANSKWPMRIAMAESTSRRPDRSR